MGNTPQRSNKFAYHLVLDATERVTGGPAWALQQRGIMEQEWREEPQYLSVGRRGACWQEISKGDSSPAPCATWEKCAGDAGWAGVLAQSFIDDARRPSFIIVDPGAEALGLVAEALRLLPPSQRWEVTFNTYFSTLPMGTTCAWRLCLENSQGLRQARRMPDALVLNLTAGARQSPDALQRLSDESPLVDCARKGTALPAPADAPEDVSQTSIRSPKRAARLRQKEPPPRKAPSVAARATTTFASVGEDATAPIAPDSGDFRRIQEPKPGSVRRTAVITVLAVFVMLSVAVNIYLFAGRNRATGPSAPSDPPVEVASASPGSPGAPLDVADPSSEDPLEPPDERVAVSGDGQGKTPVEVAPSPSDVTENPVDTSGDPTPQPDDGANHSEPTVRYEMRAGLDEVSSGLASKGRASLSLAGVGDSWRVEGAGRWNEGQASESVRWRKEGDALVFLGKDPTLGTEEDLIRMVPKSGQLVFEESEKFQRRGNHPTTKQMATGLGLVSWIKLVEPTGKQALVVLAKPLRCEMQLRHGENRGEAVGEVTLPAHMAGAIRQRGGRLRGDRSMTDEGANKAAVSQKLIGDDLRIKFVYPIEEAPTLQTLRDNLTKTERELAQAKDDRDRALVELKRAEEHFESAKKERGAKLQAIDQRKGSAAERKAARAECDKAKDARDTARSDADERKQDVVTLQEKLGNNRERIDKVREDLWKAMAATFADFPMLFELKIDNDVMVILKFSAPGARSEG